MAGWPTARVLQLPAYRHQHCSALSPTPVLSSLPCPRLRAGSDEVIAVEQSQHMCDVGEEATIANGFLGKIMMLDK